MEHIDGYAVEQIREITGLAFDDILRVYYGKQSDVNKQNAVINAARSIKSPIRVVKRQHASTLTIIVPGSIVDDYSGTILRGVHQVSEGLQYNRIVHWQAHYRILDEYYAALFSSGLVGQGAFLLTRDHAEIFAKWCQQYNCPYVIGDGEANEPQVYPGVGIDNSKAVREAAQYLLECGHRRIGYITGQLNVPSAKWRLHGYKAALEAAGVPLDEDLIVEGNWLVESGQTHAAALLALADPPTALMTANDLMAIGALIAVKSAGLNVPDDVALIGFDDISMASTTSPSLTTIRQPLEQLGQAAAEMLHQMIQQGNFDIESRFIDTELVIRESVGTPAAR